MSNRSAANELTLILSNRPNSAIVAGRNKYNLPKFNGRGQNIAVGSASSAQIFVVDGDLSTGAALRFKQDSALAMEINHRKFVAGTDVSAWSVTNHPEFACRFVFNSDRTISPADSTAVALGLSRDNKTIELVARGSSNVMHFVGNEDVNRVAAANFEVEEKQRERDSLLPAIAESLITNEWLSDFERNGFAKLPEAIDKDMINAALKEINRELGMSSATTDKFKAKTSLKDVGITDLFNKSVIPHVMEILLGKDHTYRQHAGQIALRFPGDACVGNTAKSNPAHFEVIASHWHIDGCAGDFIPGVTDHYGEIHNFDCLVGVCLSPTVEPSSGELCCWPGSHERLSKWLDEGDNLQRLKQEGNKVLPNGAKTKELFKGLKPVNCLAQPGDVFLANYMTAHCIAPNQSPNIRYAVYFRVYGKHFQDRHGQAPESMLHPWLHWTDRLLCNAARSEESKGESKDESKWESQDAAFGLFVAAAATTTSMAAAGAATEARANVSRESTRDFYADFDNFNLTPTTEGWACVQCTYLHTGVESDLAECAMCGGVRAMLSE
jgi:ectoine hydroxylase-related dioxygenase (phytanoyl-CoA dioxygenase family)